MLINVCIVRVMIFPLVMYECESWTIKKVECWRWCLQTVVVEKTLESPSDSKEIKPVRFPKGNQPWIFIEMTECWSWSSNTLATWCEEWTYFKRPWCWERLRAGREAGVRGWDGWMASLTQWTWVWANSRRWRKTGKPGVLQFTGLQRVRHNWATHQQKQKQAGDHTKCCKHVSLLVLTISSLIHMNRGKPESS